MMVQGHIIQLSMELSEQLSLRLVAGQVAAEVSGFMEGTAILSTLPDTCVDPLAAWGVFGHDFPSLSALARYIYGSTVNSASTERLFSAMGRTWTKATSRMLPANALKRCQVAHLGCLQRMATQRPAPERQQMERRFISFQRSLLSDRNVDAQPEAADPILVDDEPDTADAGEDAGEDSSSESSEEVDWEALVPAPDFEDADEQATDEPPESLAALLTSENPSQNRSNSTSVLLQQLESPDFSVYECALWTPIQDPWVLPNTGTILS